MFGYIPPEQISNLAVSCERFINNHLEDREDKKDFSLDCKDGKGKGGKMFHNFTIDRKKIFTNTFYLKFLLLFYYF